MTVAGEFVGGYVEAQDAGSGVGDQRGQVGWLGAVTVLLVLGVVGCAAVTSPCTGERC